MSVEDDIPMPEGNGDKDCPKCRGRGVTPLEIDGWPGAGTQNCDCVFKRDLLANVKRVWKVLLSAESVESSPLLKLTKENVWITASNHTLRRHLRYVAFRMGVNWDARVVADASLITAWLATAVEIKDPDVRHPSEAAQEFDGPPSSEFMTLLDLVAPYDLLIIRLGIKAAANKEMANVLAEALNERDMLGKPTWVVDDPGRPLAPGHKCYSEDVLAILEDYERMVLKSEANPLLQGEYPMKPLPEGVIPVGKAPVTAANYGIKAVALQGLQSPVITPTRRAPATPPITDDEDEFSPAALAAAAVTPKPTPERPDAEVEEEETGVPEDFDLDLDDVASNFPSAAELRSNGTPSWLAKMTLTADERKDAQRKAKRDKKKGGR